MEKKVDAKRSEIQSRKGNLEKVDRLFSESHGAETQREVVESGDTQGRTPLLFACREGQDDVVERLLATGANIERPTKNGATPIFIACQNGHQNVVERLLSAGANVDTPNRNGATPLFMACQNGHFEVLEKLLTAGANMEAPTNRGTTPLHIACQNGHSEVVERLIVAGVEFDTPRKDGATSLFLACQKGRQAVVERLLAVRANTEAGKNGATPLHVTSHIGHQSVVEILLSVGANPSATFYDLKPIDLATEGNHLAIVSLLSRPLPAAIVAAHQQRIEEVRAQLKEARLQYFRVKRQSQMDLTAAKTKAQQEAAEARQLLQQKNAELEEVIRGEKTRTTHLLVMAELSNFNVDQGQLDVDAVHFAKGGNGLIHRGTYHGTAVAVKYLSEGVPEMYKKEVRMWCRLRHPNVLQLLGLSLDISRPMIVMELMERSLFEVLQDKEADLPWRRRVEMAHGVAAGLSYIHAEGAVHRDIKSLNVLVKGWEVKIADFGSTRGQESLKHTMGEAGTLFWLAPELFSNAPSTPKVDVYAFGVVMFELATREIPWKDFIPAAIMGSVLAGDRPQVKMELFKEAAGPEFVDLMQQCWNQNAEDRPTSTEVLKELTAILGVTLQPSSSSLSSSSSPIPFPLKTPPQANYGNFSGFSLPVAGPSTPLPACSSTDWSVEEWLTSIGLPHYIPTFQQNNLLTRDLIKELSVDELKGDLDITPLGDRKTIVNAAKLL